MPISNLHDIGDLDLPKQYGRAEQALIHPLVRGRDLQRWSVTAPLHILFVQDPERRQGIDAATMEARYPSALEFLSRFEKPLRARKGLRALLEEDEETGESAAPYWSMFGVGPYTEAKHKVVWKDQASDFAAAALSGSNDQPLPLPNHKVMLVACSSRSEALYLSGVLNSTAVRLFVASYSVSTAIATHVVKYVEVPKYDASSDVHRRSSARPAERTRHQPKARSRTSARWTTQLRQSGISRLTKQMPCARSWIVSSSGTCDAMPSS